MPLKTDAARQLLDYHERTKHHFHRYARSAGYMDWDNQPSPFRTYDGTRTIPLPLTDRDPAVPYADLYRPIEGAAFPLDIAAFGTLLEFSLALSAWKAIPGHRWALRINPSSGNLHPTEAHWIAVGVAGLPDGLYHYHPLTHALEERARLAPPQVGDLKAYLAPPCLLMMLSSIYWRESWKYGERAFRYCQHDVGHALAAVRLAARLLGWRLVVLEAADADIASAFGFDRTPWPPGDAEDPALLAAVFPAPSSLPRRDFPP